MSRRAFTLVELLVIVAIVAVMTTAAVVGVASGQRAVRVKGAARDVFSAIRHARSTALVTQEPAIITYSNDSADGEPMAKIEITSAKLFESNEKYARVRTLWGDPVRMPEVEEAPPADAESGAEGESGKGEGRSVVEILFSPVDEEVVRGMRVKVVHGDELPASSGAAEERTKPKTSVFSNVDYLLGRFKDAKAEAARKEAEKASEGPSEGQDAAEAAADEGSAPVSIVWESNGRVEPHQVWVYPDGGRPEDGLMIRVDRFGAAKVVSGDGRED